MPIVRLYIRLHQAIYQPNKYYVAATHASSACHVMNSRHDCCTVAETS